MLGLFFFFLKKIHLFNKDVGSKVTLLLQINSDEKI